MANDLGIVFDVLSGFFDFQAMRDGFGQTASHSWKHHMHDEVKDKAAYHLHELNGSPLHSPIGHPTFHLTGQLDKLHLDVDRIESATPEGARATRFAITQLQRETGTIQSKVQVAIAKLSASELPGKESEETKTLLGELKNHSEGLEEAKSLLQKQLFTVNARHSVPFTQSLLEGGRNIATLYERFSYKRPVTSGIFLIGGLVVVPLMFLIQDTNRAVRDAKKS